MGDHLEDFLNHMSHPFHLVFMFFEKYKSTITTCFFGKVTCRCCISIPCWHVHQEVLMNRCF